jgi:DNA-binding NarL/FixJ family response regulator
MDVAMPDLNGIEATRQLLQASPSTGVVALSMHDDRRFVGEMLRAGARAYLLKTCEFEELLHAIRCVLAGRRYLTPEVTSMLVDDYLDQVPPADTQPAAALSPKEREVLQLLAEGLGAKAIALRLDVSVKTIHTHRQHIMDKLDAHSLADLTKYAIREGITSL